MLLGGLLVPRCWCKEEDLAEKEIATNRDDPLEGRPSTGGSLCGASVRCQCNRRGVCRFAASSESWTRESRSWSRLYLLGSSYGTIYLFASQSLLFSQVSRSPLSSLLLGGHNEHGMEALQSTGGEECFHLCYFELLPRTDEDHKC